MSTHSRRALLLLALLGWGCQPPVQSSLRPYVAVPPAPPQGDLCQLNVLTGPLPTPGPDIVPVARIECRYQSIADQPTCRGEIRKLACRSGANTIGGLQEYAGFVGAEAIYMAPRPQQAQGPQAVAQGPQVGDPLPPEGSPGQPPAGPPPGPPAGPPPGPPAGPPPGPPAQPPPQPPRQPAPVPQPPAATAAPAPPPPAQTAAPEPQIPETLAREDVASGMNGVKPAVQQCMTTGNVTRSVSVSVEIAGTGRVSNATVEGASAGTSTAACIEAAVLGAQFRVFSGRSITVRYPFPPP